QEKVRGTYRRVEAIVRELVGPGASDDDVRACVLSVQGQCLFYRHCHPVLTRLFPERSFGREEVPELARHIVRFSLAGIRATGRITSAFRRSSGRREQGRIVPHPVFPDSPGPAARSIENDADVREVIALFRLNYDRAVARNGLAGEARGEVMNAKASGR